jgi:hypothetical protein
LARAFGGGGCAFLVTDGEQCGAPRKLASSYCPAHHALCYLAAGSRAERERLRLIELLGRWGLRPRREGLLPSLAPAAQRPAEKR